MKELKINLFGEKATLHHIGLATRSIDQFNTQLVKIRDETQKVFVSFLRAHKVRIEVIEPLVANSPVSKALCDGYPLVHLCFQVPNLEKALKRAKTMGLRPISQAVGAPAFHHKKIIWLYSKNYGLIELLEK